MSEKFGKGKILREMEKQIESEISNNNKGNMQEFLQNYFENRKKLHKMKILKELYLESWSKKHSFDKQLMLICSHISLFYGKQGTVEQCWT